MSKCKRLLAALKFSDEQQAQWESLGDDITDEQILSFANSAPIANDWKAAAQNDEEFIKKVGAEKYGQLMNIFRSEAQKMGLNPETLEGKGHKEIFEGIKSFYKDFVEKEGGTAKKELHDLQAQLAEKETSLQDALNQMQKFETEVIPQREAEIKHNFASEYRYKDLVTSLGKQDKFTVDPKAVFDLTFGRAKEAYDFDMTDGFKFLNKGSNTIPYEGTEAITPESWILKQAEAYGMLKKTEAPDPTPKPKEGTPTPQPKINGFGMSIHPNAQV